MSIRGGTAVGTDPHRRLLLAVLPTEARRWKNFARWISDYEEDSELQNASSAAMFMTSLSSTILDSCYLLDLTLKDCDIQIIILHRIALSKMQYVYRDPKHFGSPKYSC